MYITHCFLHRESLTVQRQGQQKETAGGVIQLMYIPVQAPYLTAGWEPQCEDRWPVCGPHFEWHCSRSSLTPSFDLVKAQIHTLM